MKYTKRVKSEGNLSGTKTGSTYLNAFFRKASPILIFLLMTIGGRHTLVSAQDIPQLITSGFDAKDTNQIKTLIKMSAEIKEYKTDSALVLLRKALNQSKQSGYHRGVVASYLGIGFCLLNKLDYQSSKHYFDSAYYFCFVLYEGIRDTRLAAQVHNGLAAYYTLTGDYNTALSHYYTSLKGLKLNDKKDTTLLKSLYSNIGGTFMQLNQPDKALYYLEKSVALCVQTRDSQSLMHTYHNIAGSYQNKGAYQTAEEYYLKIIAFYKRQNGRSVLQDPYYGLGRNYLFLDKAKEALDCFHAAVRADSAMAKNNSSLLQGMGGANFLLGNYALAEQQYKAALIICRKENLFADKLSIYSSLGKIYNATRQYQLAYTNQVAFSDLYDSLYQAKIAKATNELEVHYRVSEKDKEIAQKQVLLLKQQSRIRDKNIWIGSIGGGALLLIVILGSLYRHKRHKERLQKELIRNLEKEKEINALRAKMEGEEEERTRLARDLHDGVVVKFSAVKMNLSVLPESYPDLAKAIDFKKIIFNLDQATQELRKTAHNLMPDALLEGGLSEAVFYFCKDLQQSSGVIIDFQQFVDLPRLLPSVELSVYRIIQELLQNVVKHADATRAIVQLSHNENLLNITIEDNGKGFNASRETTKMAGIGIRNIYARMTTLSGRVDIESREGMGTTIYLELDTCNYIARSA